MKDSDERRFWAKVDRRGPNECWVWTAGVDRSGYGQFWLDKKHHGAHRVAFLIQHGRSAEACVCHTCDNPRCVNPRHLWEGTNAENIQDRNRKGRAPTLRGEKHGGSRLEPSDVLEIRKNTLPARQEAARWGVTPEHIRGIRQRKTWRHL